MGEFFRGWRRKVGVVTLLMACVFAAAWVRSFTKSDQILIRRYGHVSEYLASQDSGFGWKKEIQFSLVGSGVLTDVPYWEFVGVRCGMTLLPSGAKITVRIVPYWFLVLPLTLLSAFLLLSKPRSSTPQKTALPIQDERGGAA